MAGHSILYLGNSKHSAAFGKKLKTYSCCKELIRRRKLTLPKQAPHPVDLILFETPNRLDDVYTALDHILEASNCIPIVAITVRATEHLGIAAVQAGARGAESRRCRNRGDLLRGSGGGRPEFGRGRSGD